MLCSHNTFGLALVGLLCALNFDASSSAKIIPQSPAYSAPTSPERLVELARDALDNNMIDGADILENEMNEQHFTEPDIGDISTAALQAEERELKLEHSPNHFEILTTYDGSIKSTHGIEFKIENKNIDGQYAIVSGLGLNVAGSPTSSPCRIKLYTKSIDSVSSEATNDSAEYQLALDTKDVMCSSEGLETLIPTGAFVQYYRSKTTQSEDDKSYPLLIPPNRAVSFYAIVLPVEDEQPNPFTLISSSGTVDSALYKADENVNIYEGRSVFNAYLVDDPKAAAAEITAPTIFNGAVYYDLIDASNALSDYYDDLEYSLLSGDIHDIKGCDVSVSTGYVDTIGSFGLMFDVASAIPPDDNRGEVDDISSKYKDLEIFGMDVYIRNLVNTSIEVYARSNGEGGYMSYSPIEGQTRIVDNWELVAKGTIEGRGPGVGTPVPPEAWLKNVVVKPGHVVGFYVTVMGGPDLRYRNSSIPEGSIYATDGVLNIGVGRSWGEYPLRGDGSDVSFQPREFSGTFHYHAYESACKSEPPSAAPTITPAPTMDIANAYKDKEGMCPSESELATTFQDGTGSYCILFDVSPKVDLTITGMDLNVSIHL